MILSLTLCSLDRIRGMVDVYIYIIRVVNILTCIYSIFSIPGASHGGHRESWMKYIIDAPGNRVF